MPNYDLCDPSDRQKLDPLASFRILAAMCYPTDETARQRMLGTVNRETGVGSPRRSPLDNDEFARVMTLHSMRGFQVGHLFLTVNQLKLHGHASSLRLAIKLHQTQLPAWVNKFAPNWSREDHINHYDRSRRLILKNVKHYQSVAHLWASWVYIAQAEQHPLDTDTVSWPNTLEGVIGLLNYAEGFLRLYLQSYPSNRPMGHSVADYWRLIIPHHMVEAPSLSALPLALEWRRIIAAHDKRTH